MAFTKWEEIAGKIARSFRMTDDETSAFFKNPTAKLIAAVPFIAGCDDAMRTALSHLAAFVVSTRDGKVDAAPKPTDNADVYRRFEMLSNFRGGDGNILKKAKAIMAERMLEDYYIDRELDAKNGKYNPIVSGDIDYETELAKVRSDAEGIECPELDELNSQIVIAQCSWWMSC